LAILVAAVGLAVYRSSDLRNADLRSSASASTTTGATAPASSAAPVPAAVQVKWTATTDAAVGSIASASGVVVTTDKHTIAARDATTGLVRWSYTRSNRTLCAVGSGDIGPADMSSIAVVPGITTVYEEGGFCSQVATFDPVSGARGKVRTSPNQEPGSLVFGGPYAAWLGTNRLELWRYDLDRTIQYGQQVNPPKPGQSRVGCTFTDIALANSQFATVEHCPADGKNARVVLNFADPGSVTPKQDGWDVFQHSIRFNIDTGAAAARIVGITADRVAVLVSGPTPAVVVYDAAGQQTSSTAVDIPSADIIAADSVDRPATVTPAVQTGLQRFSLVGSHLVAVSTPIVHAAAPATSFSNSPATTTSTNITNALNPAQAPEISITDVHVDWVAGDAIGLPAVLGSTVLMPVNAGLATFPASDGPGALGTPGTHAIAVDRGTARGRVDATAVGTMIIEDRGTSVVGLG